MRKNKKQSFMQGIITLMLSQVLIKLLGLAYRLYLTNKEGFGDTGNAVYSSGFQIYTLILTISCVGVPNAVSKLVSERLSLGDNAGANKIFKVAFAAFSIIGFIGAVGLFYGAHYLANDILQMPETELTLIVLAPSVFFESLISVYKGYFNGHQNMKPMAVSQTLEQITKTSFTIFIVEIICNIFGNSRQITFLMAAGANLATTISTFIGLMYFTKMYYEVEKNRSTGKDKLRVRTIIKNIIILAMPMTISAVLGSLNKNIDAVTVVRGLKNFLTEEQAQVQYGILSGKIDTLIMLPLSFNIAFSIALIPSIASSKASGNMNDVKKRISFSLLFSILMGLPFCVGMMIYARPILELLFPNASSGTTLLQISSISIIFIMIEQTITGALQGVGKNYVPVVSLLCGVLVKSLINLIFTPISPEIFPLGGIYGAAFGTIMCHSISTLIDICALRKSIKFDFTIEKFIIRPLAAVTFMGVISYAVFVLLKDIIVEKIATLIAIGIAAIIYIISIFILKIFSKEEIKSYIS